jgi:hypothetical protein
MAILISFKAAATDSSDWSASSAALEFDDPGKKSEK